MTLPSKLVLLLLLAPQLCRAQNYIVTENARTGDGNWAARVNSADGIEAYSTVSSASPGETIPWRISTTTAAGVTVTAAIYRYGYYQGYGGAQIARFTGISVRPQTACYVTDPVALVYDCPWTDTWSMPVGSTWVTGLYQVNWYSGSSLTPSALSWFVVRNDSSTADILFVQSEWTYAAYNPYGWYSAYQAPINTVLNPTATFSCPKSSLNRPLGGGVNMDVEFAWRTYRFYSPSMIHYLESNGYSVTYAMQRDLEVQGADLLKGHKVFLSQGHDEYWTAYARGILEVAKQMNTIHQVYYGSNNVYWQVHFEDNQRGEKDRIMLHKYNSADGSYKVRSVNPFDPNSYKSKALRTSIFDEVYPARSLIGVTFLDYGVSTDCYNMRAVNSGDKYWNNTNVASSPTGTCVVGYEWDGVLANDPDTPTGITYIMNTTITSKNIQCHAIRYEDPSGAKVFSAGANHISWALIPPTLHKGFYNFIFDPNALWWKPVYQMTYNMFRDMGALPTTPTTFLVTW